MNALVVYYSRSGRMKSVAERIAREPEADIEEVREFGGSRGDVRTMLGAIFGRTPRIGASEHSVGEYHLVVIGTPVWGAKPAPEIQALLSSLDLRCRPIGLFCTMSGTGDTKTFAKTKGLLAGADVKGRLSFDRPQLEGSSAVEERVRLWTETFSSAETG